MFVLSVNCCYCCINNSRHVLYTNNYTKFAIIIIFLGALCIVLNLLMVIISTSLSVFIPCPSVTQWTYFLFPLCSPVYKQYNSNMTIIILLL